MTLRKSSLKKLGLLTLIIAMIFTFAACDSDNGDEEEATTTPKISSFESVTEPVPYGTSESDAIAALPDEITAKLSNGNDKTVSVEWAAENYDSDTAGEYTFKGTVNDSANEDDLIAEATVTVEEATQATNESFIRIMGNDTYEDDDTAYTVAKDGARSIDVRFENRSSGTIEADVVKVDIFKGKDLVEDYRFENESLKTGKSTIGEEIAPALPAGDYEVTIDVWETEGGNPDFSSTIDLKAGAVVRKDVYTTYDNLTNALNEAGDDCEITLYADVAGDSAVENDGVTLNLNGFELDGNLTVGIKDASTEEQWAVGENTTINNGVIAGNLNVEFDGEVVANDVDISELVIYQTANSKVTGEFTKSGIQQNSKNVETWPELQNALITETENIYLQDDITTKGEININYEVKDHDVEDELNSPTIHLRGFELTLDENNIVFSEDGTITAGREGKIVGESGTEKIQVNSGATGTLAQADAGRDNELNLQNLVLSSSGNLVLDVKTVMDQADNDEIPVTLDDGTITISSEVEIDNPNLTVLFDGTGVVTGSNSGKLYGSGDVLFTEDLTDVDVKDLTLDANKTTVEYDGTITTPTAIDLSNLTLDNTTEIKNNGTDATYDGITVSGDLDGEGTVKGASGSNYTDHRLWSVDDYNVDGLTFRELQLMHEGEVVTYSDSETVTFDSDVDVDVDTEGEFNVAGEVKIDAGAVLTFIDNDAAGAITGKGLVSGTEGELVIDDAYSISGGSWLTFHVPMFLNDSTNQFSQVEFNRIVYNSSSAGIDIVGDMKAAVIGNDVRGRVDGRRETVTSGQFSTEGVVTLYNLTLENIEEFAVNQNTIIANHSDVDGTYAKSSVGDYDIGMAVDSDTDFAMDTIIADGYSLIIEGTAKYMSDSIESLTYSGAGALRGRTSKASRESDEADYAAVVSEDGSNPVIFDSESVHTETDYGSVPVVMGQDTNLEFDVRVDLKDNLEAGIVEFMRRVTVLEDAADQLVILPGKEVILHEELNLNDNDFAILTEEDADIPSIAPLATDRYEDIVEDTPDKVAGTIRGTSQDVLITDRVGATTPASITLGDRLKVDTLTFDKELSGINVEDNDTSDGIDYDRRVLTLANVIIEDNDVDFEDYLVLLDGDLELVKEDETPLLTFESGVNARSSYDSEDNLAILHGNGNKITGQGALEFLSDSENDLEAVAEAVTFDLDTTGYPYEVMADKNGTLKGHVDFSNVNWTNAVTVGVMGNNEDMSVSTVLRVWGDCNNEGWITTWGNDSDNPGSIERITNLVNPDNITVYDTVKPTVN